MKKSKQPASSLVDVPVMRSPPRTSLAESRTTPPFYVDSQNFNHSHFNSYFRTCTGNSPSTDNKITFYSVISPENIVESSCEPFSIRKFSPQLPLKEPVLPSKVCRATDKSNLSRPIAETEKCKITLNQFRCDTVTSNFPNCYQLDFGASNSNSCLHESSKYSQQTPQTAEVQPSSLIENSWWWPKNVQVQKQLKELLKLRSELESNLSQNRPNNGHKNVEFFPNTSDPLSLIFDSVEVAIQTCENDLNNMFSASTIGKKSSFHNNYPAKQLYMLRKIRTCLTSAQRAENSDIHKTSSPKLHIPAPKSHISPPKSHISLQDQNKSMNKKNLSSEHDACQIECASSQHISYDQLNAPTSPIQHYSVDELHSTSQSIQQITVDIKQYTPLQHSHHNIVHQSPYASTQPVTNVSLQSLKQTQQNTQDNVLKTTDPVQNVPYQHQAASPYILTKQEQYELAREQQVYLSQSSQNVLNSMQKEPLKSERQYNSENLFERYTPRIMPHSDCISESPSIPSCRHLSMADLSSMALKELRSEVSCALSSSSVVTVVGPMNNDDIQQEGSSLSHVTNHTNSSTSYAIKTSLSNSHHSSPTIIIPPPILQSQLQNLDWDTPADIVSNPNCYSIHI
eukprot:GHVL01032955.1.p1 GENE.GHVL01032955.1~~GHVL01032955.1.p1  ORF type:complete len:625 (+),score=73.57 GHVL01032955.1:340-2214(+)